MLRRSLGVLPLAALGVLPRSAGAQSAPFPNRPVRIVVPFAAGGTADVLARLVGDRLSAKWNQQVIVDNRPGAGGNIGAEQVARAPGDGHTLLLGTIGIHAASSIYSRLPYNPDTDLAPVTVLAEMPNAIIVHPSVPARTLRELIGLARQQPGALTFGSAGSGSSTHMAGELFMQVAGVRMVHAPYRGSAAALNDLVAGSIQVMFENVPTVPPLAQAGSVRVLAVTSAEPVSALPDAPPATQAGLPDYVATAWMTLAAPSSVPAPLLQRLNADTVAVLNEPPIQQRLAQLGAIKRGLSVDESRRFFAEETQKWTRVIQTADIRVN
ncbi:Bug family tripartite tricarboxylate transporter substrate binding protein [Sabulicella rubraurantiaca]|uniref:Bug family tripartite tricarboxylate transporter substrate binding protein n=1 Tax=Sabulicella rubraurantiaca TaxID=2811429 RepID=UPI001A9684C2|nr:tripartite tricarboxylate transporter substrate binding protein [Sabulicella rubraurantiaca]